LSGCRLRSQEFLVWNLKSLFFSIAFINLSTSFHLLFPGLSNASIKDTSFGGHRSRHSGNGNNGQQQQQHLKRFTGLYTGPYFDTTGNPENVTVQLGESALLPCKIRQLGRQTVRITKTDDLLLILLLMQSRSSLSLSLSISLSAPHLSLFSQSLSFLSLSLSLSEVLDLLARRMVIAKCHTATTTTTTCP
jgi:hypothetical protein